MKTCILLTIMAALLGCQSERLFESRNFTEIGSFTAEAEGPAVDKDGNLYAVSFHHKETIGRITPEGEGSIFIEMPKGSTANGIRFSSKEEMFIADYTGHNILKADATGRVTVFAHEPKMNQPNDLAIMDDDTLFASDPNWKESTGKLWRISSNGEVTLLEENMGTTNGIEVSPDQKRLYVNESKQLNLWVYDIDSDENISNKRLLFKFPDGGLDGMRCDIRGNLYITRHSKGEVVVISAEGKVIRTIKLKGMKPTNIAFGGKDGRTCYVTIADKGNIETFRTDTPGRSTRRGN